MISPREPLTRDRIIDTALHIVDGQGLARLTMRRLGDALEVEAMAIYHHLPRGKEELLDGLIAHVAAFPATTATTNGARGTHVDWRAQLRIWGTAYRARLLEHVGVLPLLVTRRNPAALAGTAASLHEVLRRAGFLDAAATAGSHTLLGYVIGHAALEARGRASRHAADPDATASADAVGADIGSDTQVDADGFVSTIDWDRRFRTGLDVVLAGLLTLP